jgi:predicted transcriptional regulator
MYIEYKKLKTKWLKDKELKREYDALEPEFALIRALIRKRLEAKLSQAELAKKVGTKQSAISRLESGNYNPTIGMLRKVAEALDADLKVSIR